MPFAGYDDFDACVRDHGDKENAEAYCSEIHYQATGEYPSQKSMDDIYDDPDRAVETAMEVAGAHADGSIRGKMNEVRRRHESAFGGDE